LSHITFYDYGAKLNLNGDLEGKGCCKNIFRRIRQFLFYPIKFLLSKAVLKKRMIHCKNENTTLYLENRVQTQIEKMEETISQKLKQEIDGLKMSQHDSSRKTRQEMLNELKSTQGKLESLILEIQRQIIPNQVETLPQNSKIMSIDLTAANEQEGQGDAGDVDSDYDDVVYILETKSMGTMSEI